MNKWFARVFIPLSLALVIITVPLCYASPPLVNRKHVLVLDPAHGGSDAGVRLSDKLQEKNLTLMIATDLQQELQTSGNLAVRLTRDTDSDVSFAGRIKFVQAAPCDIFIGLHVNAGFGRGSSGYELYFPGFNLPLLSSSLAAPKNESVEIIQDMTKNRYLNNSVRLAQNIQRAMERVFPRKGRGLREAPIVILDDIALPAVVIEIGFATNTSDAEKLTDRNNQKALVRALGNGIKEYFR